MSGWFFYALCASGYAGYVLRLTHEKAVREPAWKNIRAALVLGLFWPITVCCYWIWRCNTRMEQRIDERIDSLYR